jgi:hypothetical protein
MFRVIIGELDFPSGETIWINLISFAVNPTMEIPFKGQHDRNTFFRAVRLANQPVRNGSRLRWLVLAALAVVIVLSIQSLLKPENSDGFTWVRLGLGLGLLLAYLLWPYGLSYIQARRIWKDPAIRQEISGRLQERGITYTNTNPYRTVPWDRYARLRLAPDLATLLTAAGVLTVLPRSFFKSDSDWQNACKLLQSKVLQNR